MKSSNQDGQLLINLASFIRCDNKSGILKCFKNAITNFQASKIESAKDNFAQAISLLNESCDLAFLRDGPEGLVINEPLDAQNYGLLTKTSCLVGSILDDLSKIKPGLIEDNIVSFYSYQIHKRLYQAIDFLRKTH